MQRNSPSSNGAAAGNVMPNKADKCKMRYAEMTPTDCAFASRVHLPRQVQRI